MERSVANEKKRTRSRERKTKSKIVLAFISLIVYMRLLGWGSGRLHDLPSREATIQTMI